MLEFMVDYLRYKNELLKSNKGMVPGNLLEHREPSAWMLK